MADVADLLLSLARDACEFFHDANGTAYATLHEGKTIPVESRDFTQWLIYIFSAVRPNCCPPLNEVRQAQATLAAAALFGGDSRPDPPLRVAWLPSKDGIAIDLANPAGEVVVATAAGWKITKASPVAFVRYAGLKALPHPVRGRPIATLRDILRLSTDDWALFVATLFGALNPDGPYPVVHFRGEHGSTKSTTAGLFRQIIDPHHDVLRSLPKSVRDLFYAAKHQHILAIDNVSSLSPAFSDALCAIATGGSWGERRLYCNISEVSFSICRMAVLTSIEPIVERPDLADRTHTFDVPPFSAGARKTEGKINTEFRARHPEILAALLDGVVGALGRRAQIVSQNAPRLADWFQWACAAEHALGFEHNEFGRALGTARDAENMAQIEAAPCGQAVIQLMEKRDSWAGTVGNLHRVLQRFRKPKERGWPENPRGLGPALTSIAPALRALGIDVDFARKRTARGRMVTLRRVAPAGTPGYTLS